MRGCACAQFNSAPYRVLHIIFRAVAQRGRRSRRVHEATYFRVRLHRTIGYYSLKLYVDPTLDRRGEMENTPAMSKQDFDLADVVPMFSVRKVR